MEESKVKLLYKDKAGNRLYKKWIKTRKSWQVFAKNKEGKLVDEAGVKRLAKLGGFKFAYK